MVSMMHRKSVYIQVSKHRYGEHEGAEVHSSTDMVSMKEQKYTVQGADR